MATLGGENMSNPLTAEQMALINQYDQEQRFNYCLKEIVANQQVWILKDEHGCVMLNTEEEECSGMAAS